MKGAWIVLAGLVAAVAYGIVSHATAGSWNFALAFVIGAVVALSLSGFRSRPPRETASDLAPSAGNSQPPDKNPRHSAPDAQPSIATSQSPTPDPQLPTFDTRPPTPDPQHSALNVQPVPQPSGETAEDIWKRAREMPHDVIPDPVKDSEYLDLITAAAELGHVLALAKLGDYAFRRGAFVEAYFWTTMAKCRLAHSDEADARQLKEIGDMLHSIRREWAAAGQPLEFENVYEHFSAKRGELGRAFLRLDAGIEVWQTRKYIQRLVDRGNPDAALFSSAGK